MEALESETACRLKKWDLERVHQLKEKEDEEDKKAWDKMYRIQVKAISHSHSSNKCCTDMVHLGKNV